MSKEPAATQDRPLGKRLAVWGIGILVGVVVFFIGAAFLPRWWSQRIGDQVDGSTAQGIGVGLFYGVVFTFLPLLVLWLVFRQRRPWKVWLAGAIGALILAAPNLLTLGIVIGRGDAAHAAERTLDVRAPYFRASSLIGAIVAAAAFAATFYILKSRKRSKQASKRLREELRIREAADKAREEAARPVAESDQPGEAAAQPVTEGDAPTAEADAPETTAG